MTKPVIIDEWTGGSSPFCQYHYRVVLADNFIDYRLEVRHLSDPDEDGSYRPVTQGSRHHIARGIFLALQDDFDYRRDELVGRGNSKRLA